MANITKRGDSYRIIISGGYDINGKKITHTMTWKPENGMTERQIQKEINIIAVEFEKKYKNGQLYDSKMRFEDYVNNYWLPRKIKEVEPTTFTRYKGLLKRILPAIGHYRMENIHPNIIYSFYDNLYEEKRIDTKYTPKPTCINICKNQYTRTELSKQASISMSAIDSIRAEKNINEKSAVALSKFLKRPIDDLFIPNEKQLSSRTILHHHRLLSDIMQEAVYDSIILINPISRVRTPKVEQKEARYLDEHDAVKLMNLSLEKAPKPYDVLIPLLLLTGMRRGEACGLEWNDINYEKCQINIVRSSLYLAEKGIFESTPKTLSSRRVVQVDGDLIALLQKHKEWQENEANKIGDKWHENDRLFTTWNGKPINPGTVTKWFYNFISENNLPNVCLHSLRHTNATLMIAANTPISAVAQRLGHSTSATTSKIYIHAIQSANAAAADTLKNILPLPKI